MSGAAPSNTDQGSPQELRVQPKAVAFFDDNLSNVEAAASFGMAAHHVRGVAETRKCLVGAGLL